MERMAGKKLKEQWQNMSWLKKEVVVRKVAEYLMQLFFQRFHRLGSVYATQDLQNLATIDIPDVVLLGAEDAGTPVDFYVGEVVSIELFYNDHWRIDVARGPYKHSQHWLTAYLELAAHDVENMSYELDSNPDSDLDPGSDSDSESDLESDMENGKQNETQDSDSETSSHLGNDGTDSESKFEDGDNRHHDSNSNMSSEKSSDISSDSEDEDIDPESIAAAKSRIQCLKHLLPRIFPGNEQEEFILHHQDLSDNNIMIDAKHNLSAIIDWGCIHTVPL